MLLWYSLCQMYKRYRTTVLTIVMLAIGFAVIYYAMLEYAFYQYPKTQAKRLCAYDIASVYMMNYQIFYAPIGGDELSEILAFNASLDAVSGVQAHGTFFWEESFGADNKMYIQHDITSLCSLDNIDGHAVNYDTGDSDYGFAVVGYGLAGKYPVGSIYSDAYGGKYIITDILQKNSCWIPASNIGNEKINLNDALILDYDYLLSRDIMMLINGLTSYYIVSDGNVDFEKLLSDAADAGLHFYGVYNIEDKYDRDIMNNMQEDGETYYFPMILYIAAIITLIMSALISLYVNKRDMGIMLANGITMRQLIAMVFLQNIIKILVSAAISSAIWGYYSTKLTGAMRELVTDLIPEFIALLVFSAFVTSIIPIRYIRKKRPYELMR